MNIYLTFLFSLFIPLFADPVVIFLNGTSSAGKSSIAKEIQKLSELPFLHTGIDKFIDMLSPSYLPGGQNDHLGFQVTLLEGPTRIVQVGSAAKCLIRGAHRSMRDMLDQGFSLILDEVLISDEDYQDYLELFKGIQVLFVGVKLPIEVAEAREKARGDRLLGYARGFYDRVHLGKTYDLEVDSSQSLPQESACLILEFLATHSTFNGFVSGTN